MTALKTIRDVALIVMAVLVSAVCVVILYLTFQTGSALAEIGSNLDVQAPEVLPTGEDGLPCSEGGEGPVAGC